jgi:cellulose biosynthesis protein BcsQ
MTYIIAIANEKGGVAKTTTTLSLGAALVEAGNEVLLIDLDAQANLTLGLKINRQCVIRISFRNKCKSRNGSSWLRYHPFKCRNGHG